MREGDVPISSRCWWTAKAGGQRFGKRRAADVHDSIERPPSAAARIALQAKKKNKRAVQRRCGRRVPAGVSGSGQCARVGQNRLTSSESSKLFELAEAPQRLPPHPPSFTIRCACESSPSPNPGVCPLSFPSSPALFNWPASAFPPWPRPMTPRLQVCVSASVLPHAASDPGCN